MADPVSVTPVSMPVANGATPDTGFHAGGNFHEFKARMKPAAAPQPQGQTQQPPVSRETPPQPPALAKQGPNPQPSLSPPPVADSNAAVDPNAPPLDANVDPNAPPVDPNAPPALMERQLSPEDHETWSKIKAALENGTLPDEFGKLMIPLKNGDQIEWEPIEEVREGRMRMKDHMRGVQQRDAERAQEQQYRQSYEEHFRAINHPETGHDDMYEIYTRNGMRPTLQKLAARFAREEQEDYDNANGVAYATMARLRISDTNDYRVQEAFKNSLARSAAARDSDDKSRADKFRMSTLEKDQQSRQGDARIQQEAQVQRNQLNQMRPRAFEAVGMNHEDVVHRDRFDQYLGAAIRQHKAKALTPELVMQAARAAREDLEDEAKRRGQAASQPPVQQPRPFVPKLGGGSGKIGGQQPPGTGGAQGWTPDAFSDHFKLRRW